MATYNTIPAAAAEAPLIQKPKTTSLKAIITGAALALVVLGALAAAVVVAPSRTDSAAFFDPDPMQYCYQDACKRKLDRDVGCLDGDPNLTLKDACKCPVGCYEGGGTPRDECKCINENCGWWPASSGAQWCTGVPG